MTTVEAAARSQPPLCGDVDVFDLACSSRDWEAIFPQAFDVENDGFTDFGFDLCNCRAGGNAARKVGHIG